LKLKTPASFTNLLKAADIEGSSAEVDDTVEEFCDVCSMELIDHADEQPCKPHGTYFKVFQACPICDAFKPTREHVSRHFLPYLLQTVQSFPNHLSCSQCDYQVSMLKTFFLRTNAYIQKLVFYLASPY